MYLGTVKFHKSPAEYARLLTMNEPGRSLIPEVMMSVFVLIAFLGGAVSITSPCTLPLLPPFIAFMVASSATENRLAFESPTLRVAARATLFMTGVLFIFWASAPTSRGCCRN